MKNDCWQCFSNYLFFSRNGGCQTDSCGTSYTVDVEHLVSYAFIYVFFIVFNTVTKIQCQGWSHQWSPFILLTIGITIITLCTYMLLVCVYTLKRYHTKSKIYTRIHRWYYTVYTLSMIPQFSSVFRKNIQNWNLHCKMVSHRKKPRLQS